MSKGTIRWFNRTIGAGFIRTDDGENVLFLHHSVMESDMPLIREGARVHLDVLENQYGLTARKVRAVEKAGGQEVPGPQRFMSRM
jgi:CspA family cold shock protein